MSKLESSWQYESESESEVTQSCLTLCDPVDCSPPGSSVHGILQARILEWVAISFEPRSPILQADALTSSVQFSSVTQLCPTLCNPTDCNLAGSSIHGIFQAGVLEWLAIFLL